MDKIAILGASKPHLRLYTKAKEMGLETYCFAWAKGAYCRDYADHFFDISITNKEEIANVCKELNIQGIIANALEPAVPSVAYVAEQLELNGISYETALRARNKYLMRKAVEFHNACLQPQFTRHKEDADLFVNYPAIIKPTDGSCSNGVTKVNSQKELAAAIIRAYNASENKEILIEECIEGIEISVEAISFHNTHHILAITDKETTGAPYFVETAHHQPSTLSEQLQQKVEKYTKNILTCLEINNGASHTEFKIDSDGNIFFIETGARGGGDFISYNLVELSTGYDFVKGMINVALNRFEPPVLKKRNYSGVYFLSKETAYVKDFIEKNRNKNFIKEFNIDNTQPIEVRKSQDRSGYFIYQADQKIII